MLQRIKEFAASSETTKGVSASKHVVLVAACALSLGTYLLFLNGVRADERIVRIQIPAAADQSAAWIDDLSPIMAQDWSYERAAHLLDRTAFGGTPEAIRRLAAMTPTEAVHYIVHYEAHGRAAPTGLSVRSGPVNAGPLSPKSDSASVTLKDLIRMREWEVVATQWGRRMLATSRPFEENMTLFWHWQFAQAGPGVDDPHIAFRLTETFRRHATGNFKDLIAAVRRDLKGAEPPDDDHRRERNGTSDLIQRFALGTDVPGHIGGIDSIVGHEACAQFISSRIYGYFVRDDISVEKTEELARILRESDYDLRPLLKTIFLSKDFYSPPSYASRPQSPVHYYVSACRKLGVRGTPDVSAGASTDGHRQDGSALQPFEGDRGHLMPWIDTSAGRRNGNMWCYLLFPVAAS